MDNSNDEGLNILLTKTTPRIAAFFDSLDHMLGQIELMANTGRPLLNGERYLTDQDLSQRLKISRRALQDYRRDGKIPYYQIGSKILYKESDIEGMLKENYRKIFKE